MPLNFCRKTVSNPWYIYLHAVMWRQLNYLGLWRMRSSVYIFRLEMGISLFQKNKSCQMPGEVDSVSYQKHHQAAPLLWRPVCLINYLWTLLMCCANTAKDIIGTHLLDLELIYTSRCLWWAHSIIQDPSHPSHHLFNLLPSGRRCGHIAALTTRMKNRFFPRVVAKLNNTPLSPICLPPSVQ